MIKKEAAYFFGAIRFFTRLPVPAWVGHSAETLNHSARYFPLVGVIVGAWAALVFVLASFVLPNTLAVLLSMVATLLLTGAFHEDGLADAVDGFGGGWAKEQVLTIMKDSRVGSYGAIAIALALLIKFNALMAVMEWPEEWLLAGFVAAHSVSRFAAVTLIYALDYVREDETARAKPLAQSLSVSELLIAALFGLAPLALLPWQAAVAGLGMAVITTLLAARYFVKRIGGYTGDCLGATQQLAEIAVYFGLVIAIQVLACNSI